MGQFHFDPATYMDRMAAEVPGYGSLQDEGARAARGVAATEALELGTGTGETARRVLAALPGLALTGIDASADMLAHADLPGADLRVARLQDPLPAGPFGLVFSALAVHHLDGPGKADLYARVAGVLRPGGSLVLGDLVVPQDPADVVTPIDGVHDMPSSIAEPLGWLAGAGLDARVAWEHRDLAVLVARAPA